MAQHPTPLRQLLAAKLEADPAAWVATHRRNGASWRSVSDLLVAATGITVSHETLRTWYDDEVPAQREAS